MKKFIISGAAIIFTIVVIFIGWQLLLNDGGVIRTGYNEVADLVNDRYSAIAGSGRVIWKPWGTGDADTNGTAGEIDVTN